MANFLFISVNDINNHGIRVLSSCLKEHGHETSVLFFKRPGFPYTINHLKYLQAAKSVEDYDWVGIHHDGTPVRYSRGPSITPEEYRLLFSLIKRMSSVIFIA